MTETIISITTTPQRLPHIGQAITTLKKQGLPVYLWIPEYCKRLDMKYDGRSYSFFNGIEVGVVEDHGPITKLFPALELGADRIITADDDRVYDGDWAKNLISWSDKLPDCAIYGIGRMVSPHTRNDIGPQVKKVKKPTEVELGEGGMGAVYWSKFFNRSLMLEYESYFYNDDISISVHLQRKGIKRMVVPAKQQVQLRAARASALSLLNMGKHNREYMDQGAREILMTPAKPRPRKPPLAPSTLRASGARPKRNMLQVYHNGMRGAS